jgi:hypothetical protein
MEQLESSIEVNQAALSAAIDALVEGLAHHRDTRLPIAELPGVPALDVLGAMFGLSNFERAIVLLCAGVELDTRIGAICSEATGRQESSYPTFVYALSVLPQPHWSALGPDSPLRRWRMIDLTFSPELPLSSRPLSLDERVLNFLIGVQQPSSQFQGMIAFVPVDDTIAPSHDQIAAKIGSSWARSEGSPPVTMLTGSDDGSKRAIAAAACAGLGLGLVEMPADAIPATPFDRATIARLWERESALSNAALYLDCHDFDANTQTLIRFIDSLSSPVLVGSTDPLRGLKRPGVTLTVRRPTTAEQRDLWRANLGPSAVGLNGHVDRLAAQFDLSGTAIRASVNEAMAAPEIDAALDRTLWDASRSQARARLDDLAERIESQVTWDDLVLPPDSLAPLYELTSQVRHRTRVYEQWGFGNASRRGLGVSALFAGPSGTGKTLAAEVLAHELRLDLYRIDLSGVVSKYIGETEKNLRRVFDAAEEGGAVLFFDEADALFGKRSEVKDSHDRYANIEVNYLLQRMESYRGVAILATNLKGSLDSAFLRRIRFVVTFPVPDAEQRAEIWRRVFPANAPVEGIDPERLALLNVTGGNIRNIAVNAAFLAAARDEPIGPLHIAQATRNEFVKLERPQPDDELRRLLE